MGSGAGDAEAVGEGEMVVFRVESPAGVGVGDAAAEVGCDGVGEGLWPKAAPATKDKQTKTKNKRNLYTGKSPFFELISC